MARYIPHLRDLEVVLAALHEAGQVVVHVPNTMYMAGLKWFCLFAVRRRVLMPRVGHAAMRVHTLGAHDIVQLDDVLGIGLLAEKRKQFDSPWR